MQITTSKRLFNTKNYNYKRMFLFANKLSGSFKARKFIKPTLF